MLSERASILQQITELYESKMNKNHPKEDTSPYQDNITGAHFRYEDLCGMLLTLQEQREDPENFTQAIDELEIEAKVKEDKYSVRTLQINPDAFTHFDVLKERKVTDFKGNEETVETIKGKAALQAKLLAKNKSQNVFVKNVKLNCADLVTQQNLDPFCSSASFFETNRSDLRTNSDENGEAECPAQLIQSQRDLREMCKKAREGAKETEGNKCFAKSQYASQRLNVFRTGKNYLKPQKTYSHRV